MLHRLELPHNFTIILLWSSINQSLGDDGRTGRRRQATVLIPVLHGRLECKNRRCRIYVSVGNNTAPQKPSEHALHRITQITQRVESMHVSIKNYRSK